MRMDGINRQFALLTQTCTTDDLRFGRHRISVVLPPKQKLTRSVDIEIVLGKRKHVLDDGSMFGARQLLSLSSHAASLPPPACARILKGAHTHYSSVSLLPVCLSAASASLLLLGMSMSRVRYRWRGDRSCTRLHRGEGGWQMAPRRPSAAPLRAL